MYTQSAVRAKYQLVAMLVTEACQPRNLIVILPRPGQVGKDWRLEASFDQLATAENVLPVFLGAAALSAPVKCSTTGQKLTTRLGLS